MTGSWTMDGFIVGSIILIMIPALVWFYREVVSKKRGEIE